MRLGHKTVVTIICVRIFKIVIKIFLKIINVIETFRKSFWQGSREGIVLLYIPDR